MERFSKFKKKNHLQIEWINFESTRAIAVICWTFNELRVSADGDVVHREFPKAIIQISRHIRQRRLPPAGANSNHAGGMEGFIRFSEPDDLEQRPAIVFSSDNNDRPMDAP